MDRVIERLKLVIDLCDDPILVDLLKVILEDLEKMKKENSCDK